MSIVALVRGCLTGLAVIAAVSPASAQHGVPPPPELPVVRLDGLPGVLGLLSGTPQRPPRSPSSLPITQLDDRGQAAQLDAPQGLSLTFAQPLAVRDVLLLLFRGTPFSLVLDPEISGTFVGELKDITLRQALESVLFAAALDYDVDGTIVRVFPRKAHTRFFSIDHLSTPRAGMDFFAEISAGVQAILSGTGKSHVDRKASLVQVTDFADRLDIVATYLETVHLRANRQVRIHARVFEVTRPEGAPIEWSALAGRPGSGVRGAPDSVAGWRVDDFDALLRTIGEIGSVRYIGAPALLAMNNEPAILRAEDSAAQLELRLTVTPQIAADRIIQMHVAPSYVDGRRVVTPAGDVGAQFTVSVDTVVRLADGDTIVIGGLLHRREAASHAEFVVLLTATTVTPAAPFAEGSR